MVTIMGDGVDVVFDVPPGLPTIAFDVPDAQPSEILILPQSGPPGPPGPSAGTLVGTAGMVLSGHRVVRCHVGGTLVYASNDAVSDVTADLFVTLSSANAGNQVTVQALGVIVESSWNWADLPVFLGQNGTLTQIAPTNSSGARFIRQIGYPNSSTSVFVNPRNPILL